MTKSGFFAVDANNPKHLVASLERRSSARLYAPYRSALMAKVAETKGAVLDIGSGGGHMVGTLKDLLPERAIIGVEPSKILTRKALAQGRPTINASGSNLPFPDGSTGCVVAERVLQHVANIGDILAEVTRVLEYGGRIILVDPHHAGARLKVDGMQDLADQLVNWRAESGTVTPNAPEVSAKWLKEHDYNVLQEVFVCETGLYEDARVITNFPEWAKLAREAGEPVTEKAVRLWEEHWGKQAHAEPSQENWFHWPVVMSVAELRPEK